jgi:hypothetical protein
MRDRSTLIFNGQAAIFGGQQSLEESNLKPLKSFQQCGQVAAVKVSIDKAAASSLPKVLSITLLKSVVDG